MKLTVLPDNSIALEAKELASFARRRPQSSNAYFAPSEKIDKKADAFFKEVKAEIRGITLISTADMVYRDQGKLSVEKIYEKKRIYDSLTPLTDPHSFAETAVCACLFALSESIETINVRITYINETKSAFKTYAGDFSKEFLLSVTDALLERAMPFFNLLEEKEIEGKPALSELSFPYKSVRAPQKEFITETYKAIKKNDRLLISAPTGVGKTISALYPALRALGRGFCDKIFYLTAKTETGIAARQAVLDMSKDVPSLRCVTILAKDRMCTSEVTKPKLSGNRCFTCEKMSDINGCTYESRRDAALAEILDNCIIDSKLVSSIAGKHNVCPYELSLDASEYAETVICDYNYVFDPGVRFRRYFVEENNQKYVFLCDEAHNLADRARTMYSADLDTDCILKLYKHGSELFPGENALISSIEEVCLALSDVVKSCRAEEQFVDESNSAGFYISSELPYGFVEPFEAFISTSKKLAKDSEELSEILEEAVTQASGIVSAASLFGEGFRFFSELINNHLSISIRCLDPSHILDRMLSSACASVLFSATLTPMEYFADILGCRYGTTLELDSPYDKDNLCLLAYDAVSNRYNDRTANSDEIAELIATVCEVHEGNYIVYFSSYEHMNGVYSAFKELCPEFNTIIQKSNMNIRERQAFLDSFNSEGDGVIGFCVLGGAFSEGVDLKGERLCGTIIVGTGLPRLSSSQNILKDYFDSTREDGYSYAYRYPAMIKVMQAVGRVIRSENDCGIAVLIDDRYGEPETYRLFPKAWSHIRFTKDPYSMGEALTTFWNNH